MCSVSQAFSGESGSLSALELPDSCWERIKTRLIPNGRHNAVLEALTCGIPVAVAGTDDNFKQVGIIAVPDGREPSWQQEHS